MERLLWEIEKRHIEEREQLLMLLQVNMHLYHVYTSLQDEPITRQTYIICVVRFSTKPLVPNHCRYCQCQV